MHLRPVTTPRPEDYLANPDSGVPVHFFAPSVLQERVAAFRDSFDGMLTYAVKANPAEHVISQLWAEGLRGFDVASPDEIALIRRLCPSAILHYNNPVRSRDEIACGIAAGVSSWSVDDAGELQKLLACGLKEGTEIAVRFKLPVAGAAYNFGAKFGATEAEAVALLQTVSDSGFAAALTFHVGTQCKDPAAYTRYIQTAARIAGDAGVTIGRLNVGGGFPSGRDGQRVDLKPFFAAISAGLDAFAVKPALICEPGRGLVADAFSYAVQVKSVRSGRVYMNDGIYGGLSEFLSMKVPAYQVLAAGGLPRTGATLARHVFGPTCDSLDQLPARLDLPETLAEGDWILFRSMGAYLTGVTTRFNGYGEWTTVTVDTL